MDVAYLALLVLRAVLVLIPQYGYIHPDEFFQTTEVVAGDVFDVEVNKPWEYTSFPIRSVSLIYILFGLPLKVLKTVGEHYPALISGYFVLVLPRLVMALLSLIVDFTLYRLCKCFDLNERLGLRLLASSYVMLTYMTRTFTNSIEAVLFAILLLLVYSDPTIELYTKFKFVEISEDSSSDDHGKQTRSAVMQLKYLRSLNRTFHLNAVSIGIVGMAGLYNRPTFAMMAIFPALIYWEAKQKTITSHAFFIGGGAMISFIVFTLVDTVYFGANFNELLNQCTTEKTSLLVCYLTTFLQWVVITPYNFLVYNMNPHHLAEHGIHPRYLHLIVNLFILFGPLTVLFYKRLLNLIKMVWQNERFHKSYFPVVMLFIPVILLSTFPHQEPRFLIPVLPFAVMIGIEQIEEMKKRKSLFLAVWILFNVILAPIYGFMHQGGVMKSLLQVERHVHNETAPSNVHDKFVFYRTYMPPNSLLISKNASSQIVDAQGGDLQQFLRIVPQRLSRNEDFKKNKGSSKIYVITPPAVVRELKEKGVRFFNKTTFYGHLSTEDFPDLAAIYNSSKTEANLYDRIVKFFSLLSKELSLQMIRMEYSQFDQDHKP